MLFPSPYHGVLAVKGGARLYALASWRPAAPAAIDRDAIGHFAFFHDRFRESLWPTALNWLLDQRHPLLPAGVTRHGDPG